MAYDLKTLETTITARAGATADKSYTRSLLDKGAAHCARKFGEESIEAIVAAVEGDRAALVKEAADVMFHLLVLLRAGGAGLDEVLAELEARTSQSGHAEKASRPKG